MKLVRPSPANDDVFVSSNVVEDEEIWDDGEAYAKGDRVRPTSSGSDSHRLFESAADGNVGNDPLEIDSTHWLDAGFTNRWTLFDQVLQSQTTNEDSIEVERLAPGRIDTVAALNISAASAQVVMTDDLDGVVYDRTISLVSTDGIDNWAAYFREGIERRRNLILDDLPPYANTTLSVTLSAPDEIAACGVLLIGRSIKIGGTQWGATVGIDDYSRKGRDDFGNIRPLERAYSDRASFTLNVPKTRVDAVKALLTDYRATPILYIGHASYASTAVFGFWKSFDLQIAFPDISYCSLDVEGLV